MQATSGKMTDEEIVKQVQNGDDDAFATLIDRYEHKLIRYAHRFLFYDRDSVEDVVQEVFIKVYVNIESFDATRKFSSWIYRIAHNELIDTVKKNRERPLSFFDPDILFPHPIAREFADREILEAETKQILEQSLAKIDHKYREVLILYYFDNMDYNDIADILHIPVSTVGVRLRRARAAMRKLINKLDQ